MMTNLMAWFVALLRREREQMQRSDQEVQSLYQSISKERRKTNAIHPDCDRSQKPG